MRQATCQADVGLGQTLQRQSQNKAARFSQRRCPFEIPFPPDLSGQKQQLRIPSTKYQWFQPVGPIQGCDELLGRLDAAEALTAEALQALAAYAAEAPAPTRQSVVFVRLTQN